MSDTTFVPGTVVASTWLNDVNTAVYKASSNITGGVARTAISRNSDWISVKDFGAIGDGVTNDASALQAALSSGYKNLYFPTGTYRSNSALFSSTAGLQLLGYGATLQINAVGVGGVGLLIGSSNGTNFVKTDDVAIIGLTGTGIDTGALSTYSYFVSVQPPVTNPYVPGGGCSNFKMLHCQASGFAIGMVATAADNVLVHGNKFTGMHFHNALGAGGYGILLQTCFDVVVSGNRLLGVYSDDGVNYTGDRHGVYVSADPSRTLDNNNVCKGVTVTGNIFDWTGVTGSKALGFEATMVSRATENLAVTGNTFRGGYGCIDYEMQNGNGKNISISGNTFDLPITLGSERACINFLRTSGSFITSNVSITGNTMNINGGNTLIGVAMQFVDSVTISGNSIRNTNGQACLQFSGTVTNVSIGDNRLFGSALTGGIYRWSGTGNDGFIMGSDKVTNPTTTKWNFVSTPANLTCSFVRSAVIRANSTVTPIIVSDPDSILASVGTDANGITATFANAVSDVGAGAMSFGTQNSNIAGAYYRTLVSKTVTIGVNTVTAGALAAVPSASNTYDISIFLMH